MIIKPGPIPDFSVRNPPKSTAQDRRTVHTQVTKTRPTGVQMNAGKNNPSVAMGHGNRAMSGTAGGPGNRQMSGTPNVPRVSARRMKMV